MLLDRALFERVANAHNWPADLFVSDGDFDEHVRRAVISSTLWDFDHLRSLTQLDIARHLMTLADAETSNRDALSAIRECVA